MALTDLEKRVLDCLPVGANNAKTFNKINLEHHLRLNRRQFCEAVEGLRNNGIAVGSRRKFPQGYYLIETEAERLESMKEYKSQILREIKILRKMAVATIITKEEIA